MCEAWQEVCPDCGGKVILCDCWCCKQQHCSLNVTYGGFFYCQVCDRNDYVRLGKRMLGSKTETNVR